MRLKAKTADFCEEMAWNVNVRPQLISFEPTPPKEMLTSSEYEQIDGSEIGTYEGTHELAIDPKRLCDFLEQHPGSTVVVESTEYTPTVFHLVTRKEAPNSDYEQQLEYYNERKKEVEAEKAEHAKLIERWERWRAKQLTEQKELDLKKAKALLAKHGLDVDVEALERLQ